MYVLEPSTAWRYYSSIVAAAVCLSWYSTRQPSLQRGTVQARHMKLVSIPRLVGVLGPSWAQLRQTRFRPSTCTRSCPTRLPGCMTSMVRLRPPADRCLDEYPAISCVQSCNLNCRLLILLRAWVSGRNDSL